MDTPSNEIYDAPVEPEVLDGMLPKKKNNTIWIIIIVVAALLLCCCLLLIGVVVWAFTDGGYELNTMLPLLRFVS